MRLTRAANFPLPYQSLANSGLHARTSRQQGNAHAGQLVLTASKTFESINDGISEL